MNNKPPGEVRAAVENGVGWIVMDNPAKHNALTPAMWRGIGDALTSFQQDPAVRCVVLTGEGEKAFCAGADIGELETSLAGPTAMADYEQLYRGVLHALEAFPKPTIAMVAGYCLGAGFALATECDLRIGAAGSRYGIPAARLGLGYHHEGIRSLTHLVGTGAAKRMLFTAERYDAQEMLRIGFLQELVVGPELASRTRTVAEGIAANAPLSLASAKCAVANALSARPDPAACAARERVCRDSEDYVEGRRAFLEKRQPRFQGR